MASTELSLVNDALARCGRRPVPSLSTNVSATTAMAINSLRRARVELLSIGWFFNRRYDEPFSPDAVTKQILIGEDIIDIDETMHRARGRDVVQQDGKLYNATDKTFEFDSEVYCDVIYDKTIANMPEVARLAVGAKAAVYLLTSLEPGSGSMQLLMMQANETLDILMAREVDSFDNSMFEDRAVAPALSRRSQRRF